MDIKDFSMSTGIRGTILGFEASASYSIQHGEFCFQGNVSIRNENICEIIKLIDEELANEFHYVMPNSFTDISAELSFSYGYDHEMLNISTDNIKISVLNMKKSSRSLSGKAFLVALYDNEEKSGIAELIDTAKKFLGINELYLYVSKGTQAVDISRLINPYDTNDSILPPGEFYSNGGFCLYAPYLFSQDKNNDFDNFLCSLLHIDKLSFFAGKNDNSTYFVLSVPKIENDILSVDKLYLELDTGKQGNEFKASGEFQLTAIPQMKFTVNSTLSAENVSLSAAAITTDPINLFGSFYLGSTAINIGYCNGKLTFGILGEMYLRKLYVFAAVQFEYSGFLKPQLICFATSRLSVPDLIENITGLIIPGIEVLDIISIDNFDFDCKGKFDLEWFKNNNITKIVDFFNSNILSSQLSLKASLCDVSEVPNDTGYALVDKYRMRHYYVDCTGSLFLRPQFYYSDVEKAFEIGNGMTVSAGIFFCARICVFNVMLKVLFSFHQQEGVLAFGMLTDIDLGIIKITSSDISVQNPIPIPPDSLLYQFLDKKEKGVVFYLQASKNDVSFYFDGKISVLYGLIEAQAMLFFQKGLVIVNFESKLFGLTSHLSLNVDYRNFQSSNFSLMVTIDTHGLEEALTKVKDRLEEAIKKCREKINEAKQSLEDAKNKVRNLYGEIDNLNRMITDCRNRLSGMSWFKKIFYAPIIGCEIAGLEIAQGAVYASIYIAEAALTVAQAAVEFAGKLGEGVLKLINGVITAVTSLFFIRRLAAYIEANSSKREIKLEIEFVALGKEYSYSWKISSETAKSTDQTYNSISDTILNQSQKDIEDLERGVVSNRYLKRKYENYLQYDDQEYHLEEAVDVLKKNEKMIEFIQKEYFRKFGETLPVFDEMENRYLETLGIIESGLQISERSAPLEMMEETVDKLREFSKISVENLSSRERIRAETAQDAVEKYDRAVRLSEDIAYLKDYLRGSRESIRTFHKSRIPYSQELLSMQGTDEIQHYGNMYEYAKNVRDKVKEIYEDMPKSVYTNPYYDKQIQDAISQAEAYFKVNS